MHTLFKRTVVLVLLSAFFSSGCLLTRVVDRAFLGITNRQPKYLHRKGTGVFLVPLTFAVDLVTFPIQALLIVFFGDDFPFRDSRASVADTMMTLESSSEYRQLTAAQKAATRMELEKLLADGNAFQAGNVLTLTKDGHLTVTHLDAEAQKQLLARLQPTPQRLVCMR